MSVIQYHEYRTDYISPTKLMYIIIYSQNVGFTEFMHAEDLLLDPKHIMPYGKFDRDSVHIDVAQVR